MISSDGFSLYWFHGGRIRYCPFCLSTSIGKRKVKLARAPSMYDIGHTSTVQYDEVQPHDLPQPSQTQPPNLLPVEEGGMSRSISNNVLEENPAYQAANAQTTTLTDGPLYL